MLQGMGIHIVHDEVTSIDSANKIAFSSSGGKFEYDKLYLATGSSSFIPPMEGNDLKGVMTLRGLPDAEKIFRIRQGGCLLNQITKPIKKTKCYKDPNGDKGCQLHD